MINNIKKYVLKNPVIKSIYNRFQELDFDKAYINRRERYLNEVKSDHSADDQNSHILRANSKVSARGYSVTPKVLGEIHTFAYIPSNWSHQNQIFSACNVFGKTSRFDYFDIGIRLPDLTRDYEKNRDRALRKFVGQEFYKRVMDAHTKVPIDWIFSYALPWDICPDAIVKIKEELGIPIVNISLDDKNWWDAIHRRDLTSGLKELVSYYDLTWTSSSSVLPWHWAEGGQAYYLPEGVNSNYFRPLPNVEKSIDVGFVGSNFGYRDEIMAVLRKANINVVCRGAGWPSGALNDADMLKFFNQSKINLGLGEMSYSRSLTNLKGRDFEIPSVGNGLYLTSFNYDLASCFSIGKEIICYRSIDDMIEQIRRYLRNEEQIGAMVSAARRRCIAEHQWSHRISAVLGALGIYRPNGDDLNISF